MSEREQDHVLSDAFLVAVIGLVNASVERDESLLDARKAACTSCVCLWIWKHAAFMYTPRRRALHILEGHSWRYNSDADNMLDQAKQNSLFPAAPPPPPRTVAPCFSPFRRRAQICSCCGLKARQMNGDGRMSAMEKIRLSTAAGCAF